MAEAKAQDANTNPPTMEEALRRPAGLIDRATELYAVLGWSFSALYLWFGGSDWMMFVAMNATLLVVSLLGGVLTATKPKVIPTQT